METLPAERHPEGLIAPLSRKDWETVLTVILHSPHYTKRVDPMEGLPLYSAIRMGAPAEVVTALLEAYPDATTIRNHCNNLPYHYACYHGISSEGMKMLLRCNPDATLMQLVRLTIVTGLRCNTSIYTDGNCLRMRKNK
jgi:hypothetical protein